VIARLHGDLTTAHERLRSCEDQFQSMLSVVRLYRELALVEYLRGERALAQLYEEKGQRVFRDIGMSGVFRQNAYRIIDALKARGEW
jgi:hypothetical protein